jgi:hypothetical protein
MRYIKAILSLASIGMLFYIITNQREQIRVLKSTNADSLQHVVDSLHDELFIQSTNVTRYEISIETLKENYPQAAEQFDECLKNTE